MATDTEASVRRGRKPRYVTTTGAAQHVNKAMRALRDVSEKLEDHAIDMQVVMAVYGLRYERGKSISDIVYLLKRWKTVVGDDGREVPDSRFWRTEKQVRRILSHPKIELPELEGV